MVSITHQIPEYEKTMADQSKSDVNAFYKGKSVFVTGGSGFMGKVLIEKLLYSCPDLKEIFFLIRPKKGRVPESRLQEMIKLPVSHIMKKIHSPF